MKKMDTDIPKIDRPSEFMGFSAILMSKNKIKKSQLEEWASQNGLKQLTTFAPCAQNNAGLFATLVNWEEGLTMDFNETTFELPNGNSVLIKVCYYTEVMKTVENLCGSPEVRAVIEQFFVSFDVLTPEQREDIKAQVRSFIDENAYLVTERVSQATTISEHLKKKIGPKLLDLSAHHIIEKVVDITGCEKGELSTEQISDFGTAVLFSGVTTYLCVDRAIANIKLLVNLKPEFEKEVAKFLQPVCNSLEAISNVNLKIITVISEIQRLREVPNGGAAAAHKMKLRAEDFFACITNQTNTCRQFVNVVIPGVCDSILAYGKLKDQLAKQKREDRNTALICAGLELVTGGYDVYANWAKIAAKEVMAVSKVALNGIKFASYAGEAIVAQFTLMHLEAFREMAKVHLDLYTKIQATVKSYLEDELDKVSGDETAVLIISLLEGFQTAGERLQTSKAMLKAVQQRTNRFLK